MIGVNKLWKVVQDLKPMKFQKALITGASRGIGKSLSKTLSGRGLQTITLGRSPGDTIVADLAQSQELASALLRSGGEIAACDLLILNAGLAGDSLKRMEQESWQDSLQMFQVNVLANKIIIDHWLRHRISKEPALVVVVSSGVVGIDDPGWGFYRITKVAVNELVAQYAWESQEGVKFLSMAPGLVDTDMLNGLARSWRSEDFPASSVLAEAGLRKTPDQVAEAFSSHLDRIWELRNGAFFHLSDL